MNEHEDELLSLLILEHNEIEISFDWIAGVWYVGFEFKVGGCHETYPLKSFRTIGKALRDWAERHWEEMKFENGA